MRCVSDIYYEHRIGAEKIRDQQTQENCKSMIEINLDALEVMTFDEITSKFLPALSKLGEIVALILSVGQTTSEIKESRVFRTLRRFPGLISYARLTSKSYAVVTAAGVLGGGIYLSMSIENPQLLLFYGAGAASIVPLRKWLSYQYNYKYNREKLASDALRVIHALYYYLRVQRFVRGPTQQGETNSDILKDELRYLKSLDWVDDFILRLFGAQRENFPAQMRALASFAKQYIQNFVERQLPHLSLREGQTEIRSTSSSSKTSKKLVGSIFNRKRVPCEQPNVNIELESRLQTTGPAFNCRSQSAGFQIKKTYFEMSFLFSGQTPKSVVDFDTFVNEEISQLLLEINRFSNHINSRVEAERNRKHHAEIVKLYDDLALYVQRRYWQGLKRYLDRIGVEAPDLLLENEDNGFEFLRKYQRLYFAVADRIYHTRDVTQEDIDAISKLSLYDLAKEYFRQLNGQNLYQMSGMMLFGEEILRLCVDPGPPFSL